MNNEIIQTVTTIPSLPPRVVGEIPGECQCCKKLQCFVDFPEVNVSVYTYKCNYYNRFSQDSCKHYEMMEVFPGLKSP